MNKVYAIIVLAVFGAIGYRAWHRAHLASQPVNAYEESETAVEPDAAPIASLETRAAAAEAAARGEAPPAEDPRPERDIEPAHERPRPQPLAGEHFACDGRRYCSQMHSCEEATWFINNCPGMKMDGNDDGVPCERQWCN